MTPLTLSDPRSLLGSPLRPALPADPASVAACFPAKAGLRLTLVAEKHIGQYSAWLWKGDDGMAYISKRFRDGRALAWATGANAKRVLHRNPSLREAPAQEGPKARRKIAP